jgi:hypothetical protein
MPVDIVYLENQSWRRVTVEAVRGSNTVPEENENLGSVTLDDTENNNSWRIESNGLDLYYRRDANPDNPDGSMTLWTHRPCYGNGMEYHERV